MKIFYSSLLYCYHKAMYVYSYQSAKNKTGSLMLQEFYLNFSGLNVYQGTVLIEEKLDLGQSLRF